MIQHLNDDSDAPPRLRPDMNMGNLNGLPDWSSGPKGNELALLTAIKEAGYEGVQGATAALCRDLGLGATAMANIQKPGQLEPVATQLVDEGYECLTLHAGSGFESQADALHLLEDILAASEKTGLPVFIETHRATLTQDIWRTVEFIKELPELRFIVDYSHWYTGLEMPNGNWDFKMEFLQPVFDRACFMHGRIGNAGHIQIDIGDGTGRPHVDHFRDLWCRTFRAFLKSAQPGDYIPFNPELLWPEICYARVIPNAAGELVEETDRWEQAHVLTRIAKECFEEARASL